MGWQAWDHYEQDANERWRALPWRERYSWRVLLRLAFVTVVAVFIASLTVR
jgi:hypothetical protein